MKPWAYLQSELLELAIIIVDPVLASLRVIALNDRIVEALIIPPPDPNTPPQGQVSAEGSGRFGRSRWGSGGGSGGGSGASI